MRNTIRTKVVDLLNVAGVCKTSVGEYYQAKNTMPATTVDAGCSSAGTGNAAAPVINAGAIRVSAVGGLQTQLIGSGSGIDLVFTPMCGTPPVHRCQSGVMRNIDTMGGWGSLAQSSGPQTLSP